MRTAGGRLAAGPHPPEDSGRRLLAPRSGPAAVALLIVCSAACAVLGSVVAGHAVPGALDAAADQRIRSGLGGAPGALRALAVLGAPVPIAVLTAAVAAGCLLTRRIRGALLAVVAVAAATAATEMVLKPLVGRTLFGSLSFPSGHATGVAALAVVVAILVTGPQRPALPPVSRLLLASLGGLLAVAVALAQVALGRHYLTDTVAGAAVGAAAALLTALLADRIAPRPGTPAAG